MSDEDDEERRRALSAPLTSHDGVLPTSSTVRVDISVRSSPGSVRHENEDHYLVLRLGRHQDILATSLPGSDLPGRFREHGYGMFVADGLGTRGSGSVAGRVALSTIARLMLQHGEWNLRIDPRIASEIFERAEWLYDRADEAVVKRGKDMPALSDMATALTAAYSAGDELFIAHVGHSRAYLVREGSLTLLTRDHTTERHLADTGKPVAMERRGQDLRHVLTDAIGAPGHRPLVEIEQFKLLHGDCVLLCTNGLTDMVPDDRIAEVLALRRRSSEQCRILVDLANQLGGEDNVTVLVAQYEIPHVKGPQ